MIEVRVNELLEERGRTFYWLAKETGISHTTLWRLKKGKAYGVTLETLDKICQALNCQPGDFLKFVGVRPRRKRSASPKT
jgi:putative transcriptional regulator